MHRRPSALRRLLCCSLSLAAVFAVLVPNAASAKPGPASVKPQDTIITDVGAGTCSAVKAADTCSVSQTATSLTLTVDLTVIAHICTSADVGSNSPSCTASFQSLFSSDGQQTSGAGDSGTCPWGTFNGGVNNSPLLTDKGYTTVQCTITWSWNAGDYPLHDYAHMVEANGNGDGLGAHDFTVTYAEPAATVDFTATPDPSVRGLYHFVSNSTELGPVKSYRWEINLDLYSSVAGHPDQFDHTFTSAGDYDVDLQINDRFNRQYHLTKTIHVTLSDLTAGITISKPDGSTFNGATATIGQQVKATVTLAAPTASTDITSVVVNPAMTLLPTTNLSLVSGPTPAVPTTVPHGGSVQYAMVYAITALGTTNLSVHVTGVEGSDNESADAATKVVVGQPLQIAIHITDDNGNAYPNDTIKLLSDDNGDVARSLTVAETIKNVSGTEQDGLAFNGPPLSISNHKPVATVVGVPVTLTTGPSPADPLGDLLDGQSVKRTYVLKVSANGVYDLTSQVTSSAGGNTNVSSGTGTFTANPTAILVLKLHPVSAIAKLITPGQPVLMAGELINRSRSQSVDVMPIEPEISGTSDNAGGGELWDSSVSPMADGVRLPLAGKLAPGKTVEVETEIDTAPVGGTRATLTYQPEGFLVGDDNKETELTSDQVLVTKGSSPVELHFDVRDPVDPADAADLAGWFTQGALEAAGEWFLSHLHAGAELLQHPVDSTVKMGKATIGMVVKGATAAKQAGHMLAALYMLNSYWETLDANQKQAVLDDIKKDFDQSVIAEGITGVQNALGPGFEAFIQAITVGDYTKAAQLSGHGLVTGGGIVADAVLTDVFFQNVGLLFKPKNLPVVKGKVAQGLISLQEGIDKFKVTQKAGAALKNVKKGQNLLASGGAVLKETYGLTQRQITLLRDFCESNGITVAIRTRSAKAADLIKKGIAVGKNIAIKLKNVDEIDTLFLGYSKADINTVVWAEPITRAELEANIARYARHNKMTPELRELAEKRWAQRTKEWNNADYQHKIHKWESSGEIELYFDGKGSGVAELDETRVVQRRFQWDDRSKVMGRYYKKVQVGKRPGKNSPLAYVTQDVDTVAVLGGNNSILPAKLRERVYEYLENILGIQHPDTVPWVLNGEVLSNPKVDLLVDHLEGGELMAVFGGNGTVNAAYFDPKLTVFDPVSKGGTIIFDGASNNPMAPIAIGSLGKLLPQ